MTSIPVSEYRQQAKKPRKNKYRNQPVVVDGIRFASKREAAYYGELRMREKAGEVGAVELQRRFQLLGEKGELICVYVADFCFWDHTQDRFRVVDVKGVETEAFKLKRRMMRVLKGIDVEVVK
jgi:hypothetical protein